MDFPIAADPEHAIWRGFKNEYWPALYFADAKGNIRHHQFGEGDYAQSEEVLQQLLAEAGKGDVSHQLAPVDARGIEAAADWQGNGSVTEQRLYQLIRQPSPITDRQFEIEFLDPGAEVFVFTFG